MGVRACVRVAVAIVVAASVSGCRSSTDASVDLSGAWIGSADGRSVSVFLSDSAGELSGSGTITNPGASLTASGTVDEGSVSISFVAVSGSVFNFFSFSGRVTSGRLEGTALGWTFSDVPLTLVRVP